MQVLKYDVNGTSCYTVSFMYLINVISVSLTLTTLFFVISHLYFDPPDSDPDWKSSHIFLLHPMLL